MNFVDKNNTMTWKPSLTNLFKKLITSANSKSSIHSGFNPILKKSHVMICKIIVSEMICRIFFNFLLNVFYLKFFSKEQLSETTKITKTKILRSIFKKKKCNHCFEDFICTNKLELFFFFFISKKSFSRTSLFKGVISS